MRTDEQLMAAYLSGDRTAFEALFQRYAPILAGYFQRHGRPAEDSRDLVQQTFLHLHRARFDFKRGEPLRPWLFTIARNSLLDHCRRQTRRPEQLADVDAHAAPPQHAASGILQRERTLALDRALARLSQRERALLDAHWVDERSFEEIAKRDGTHSTTLRVRAHRACVRLRSLIDPIHADA